MEKLKIKYNAATKSINSLKRLLIIIEKEQNTLFLEFIDEKKQKEAIQILRDSLIQRFEYSVDTLWKYLKEYLSVKRGVIQTHPKQVFREFLRTELVSNINEDLLIDMVDARNLTSHAYKEKIAQEVSEKIPEYCKIMKILLKASKP